MNNSSQYDDQDLKLLELAYSYTEAIEKSKSDVLDDLNRRLTTMLGFSGVLIRFTLDLYQGCPSAILLKLLAIFLSAFAASYSAYGLMANPTGKTTQPEVLITSDEWIERDSEINKIALTRTRIQSINDMHVKGHQKQQVLKNSIVVLIGAVIVFGLNLILGTLIGQCS